MMNGPTETAMDPSLSQRRTPRGLSVLERDAYSEYRIKLYKIAARQAQEEREKIMEKWAARDRGRG